MQLGDAHIDEKLPLQDDRASDALSTQSAASADALQEETLASKSNNECDDSAEAEERALAASLAITARKAKEAAAARKQKRNDAVLKRPSSAMVNDSANVLKRPAAAQTATIEKKKSGTAQIRILANGSLDWKPLLKRDVANVQKRNTFTSHLYKSVLAKATKAGKSEQTSIDLARKAHSEASVLWQSVNK